MKKTHPGKWFFPLIHPQGKGYEYKYLAPHSFLPIHKKSRRWTERILATSFLYHPRGEVVHQIIWLSFFRLHSRLFFFVCITCRLCAICFLVFTLSQHLSFCRCISLWTADLEFLCTAFRFFFCFFVFSWGFFVCPHFPLWFFSSSVLEIVVLGDFQLLSAFWVAKTEGWGIKTTTSWHLVEKDHTTWRRRWFQSVLLCSRSKQCNRNVLALEGRWRWQGLWFRQDREKALSPVAY